LEDKEALAAALNGSHELHEEHFNNLDGRIGEQERNAAEDQLKRQKGEEYQRNRQRVSEIYNLIERYKADIQERLAHAQSAAGDEAED
jgi:hypothetical protein